jgi:glycerophosphoryl diester phosphodiesterase
MNLPVKLYTENPDNFIIIGHRGASAYHPENTMSAFEAAHEMGAEMIEFDILLSKDEVPVVIHDETLERTTNGRGKVADFTVHELKKLDAGLWFSESHRGEQIPTLEEVLEFAKGKIALNIEIKTEAVTAETREGIEEKALRLIQKYEMEDYVLFSSFDYRAITHLREINVDISTALLYEKSQSKRLLPSELVEGYKANAFNCSKRQFTKKWAANAEAHEIPVFVYTVNKEKKMEKIINRGARGIFSDKPDVLKKVVDNMWKTK